VTPAVAACRLRGAATSAWQRGGACRVGDLRATERLRLPLRPTRGVFQFIVYRLRGDTVPKCLDARRTD